MPGAADYLLLSQVPKNVTIVDTRNNFDGKIPNTVTRDPALYTSTLGTPVLADITFNSGSYTSISGATVNYPTVRMETVLLTVDQSKKIITTEIQGRDGTVKEYIGMGDYEVSIDAILTGANGVYPLQSVLDLKNVLVAPVPISVTCAYLNRLDIYNLVVQSFSFPQEAGGYSQQNVSIKCLSDNPVSLIIS